MPLPPANPPTERETATCIARRLTRTPFDAPVPLRLWHLASFDAPTVAVVWSLSFAWAAGIRLPIWVPALLALGTWSVYVGDRLLDARTALVTGDLNRLRDRHFFHWRNRRVFLPSTVAAALVASGIIITLMPAMARERNSAMALAALAYFSVVHMPGQRPQWLARLLSKEFLVGLLFTAGCALPTVSRLLRSAEPGASLFPIALPVIFFAALAWGNCYAIDCWESRADSHIAKLACSLGVAGLLAALSLASLDPRSAALLLAGSAAAGLLAVLDRSRSRLTPLALRATADLVLLTPLALLLR
jgi:hypothetical protein